MNKLLISIIIILSAFMLFSCNAESSSTEDALPNDLENIDIQADNKTASTPIDKDITINENEMDNSTEKTPTYILKAIVKATNDHHIEVEIIESNYAFGIYHVLTSKDTKYYNASGSLISRSGIKIGDTVEIAYSGQTMLSYPPQIVAYSFKILK